MTYLKNIVITGASRGLGLEFVKQLCKTSSCHKIFASCRNPDNATELQKLADDHVQVVIKKLDVDNIDSFQPFVDEIEGNLGPEGVTCLINNAGVAPKATRYNLVKVEQMEATLKTNLIAPLFLSKAFLPLLKKNPSLIFNLSSSLGSIENNKKVMDSGGAGGGQYPYRCSKAGLNMMTRSLSIDLEPFDVGVMCVHPGWVRTDMGGKYATLTPEESIEGMINLIENYDKTKHNGQFLDYTGSIFPW